MGNLRIFAALLVVPLGIVTNACAKPAVASFDRGRVCPIRPGFVDDSLQIQISVDPEIRFGDPIKITLSAVNSTGRQLQVTRIGGVGGGFARLTNPDGHVVFDGPTVIWGEPTIAPLNPRDSVTWTGAWDNRRAWNNRLGSYQRLQPGRYCVEGVFLIGEQPYPRSSWAEFEVTP